MIFESVSEFGMKRVIIISAAAIVMAIAISGIAYRLL